MRQNFGAKPWLYPMPVLMIGTYNADGSANIMNAAWGGISEEDEITICVDSAHKTAENLMDRCAFCQQFRQPFAAGPGAVGGQFFHLGFQGGIFGLQLGDSVSIAAAGGQGGQHQNRQDQGNHSLFHSFSSLER